MSEMIITINVIPCPTCKGSGKTEQNEYTPPFESFIGECRTCGGCGVIQTS